jgi:hypothetical protein
MGETETDQGTHYDLALRMGPRRFYWRLPYAGVWLRPDRMEWAAGTKFERKYADLRSIHLSQGYVPRSGTIASSAITFRNGDLLTVTSATDRGLSDDGRIQIYRDFLLDLHARLSDDDRKCIAFTSGNSGALQMFGKITMVVATLFFVVLPLGLLIFTRDLQALYITGVGAFFVFPMWKVIRRNEPRTYDSRRLDEDLLP